MLKLSIATMVSLAQAIRALDGPAAYKLAGPVRMALAKNLARLDAELYAYEKARVQLVRDHADPGADAVSPAKMPEFTKAHQELLDAVQDVDLIRLTEPLLNLDANTIPVAVLVGLMPIMKDAAESAPLGVEPGSDPAAKPNGAADPAQASPA